MELMGAQRLATWNLDREETVPTMIFWSLHLPYGEKPIIVERGTSRTLVHDGHGTRRGTCVILNWRAAGHQMQFPGLGWTC